MHIPLSHLGLLGAPSALACGVPVPHVDDVRNKVLADVRYLPITLSVRTEENLLDRHEPRAVRRSEDDFETSEKKHCTQNSLWRCTRALSRHTKVFPSSNICGIKKFQEFLSPRPSRVEVMDWMST
jgi:hypothetical protein